MSYPKQQGYIPEYAGPPPVDLSEPECLDHAIRQNNQEKIYFFIENPTFDGEINAPGYAGQRPLHVACRKSDLKLAMKLLSSGADVNSRTDYGETPLHCAVLAGSLPIVDLLIESGANVKAVDNGNGSISHSAVRQGFVGMVHYLIEMDLFNATAKDKYGRTPLQESLHKNQMETAEVILDHFPQSAREEDSELQSAVHYSCQSLNTQITWKICETAGWDLLQRRDRGGFLPLQLADIKSSEKDRGRGNPMKPGSTPSSLFSDQFLDVTWNKKAKLAGKKIQGLASELCPT